MKRQREEIIYENDEVEIVKRFKVKKFNPIKPVQIIEPLKNVKKEKIRIKCYTDGYCRDEQGSIGIVFEKDSYDSQGNVLPMMEYDQEMISERIAGNQMTSPRAKLYSIVRALKILDEKYSNDEKRHDIDVIIYSDSQYCIKGCKKLNRRKANRDLFHEYDVLERKFVGLKLDKLHSAHSNALARQAQ